MTERPYNPLEKEHLGHSVTEALLRKPNQPLGEVEEFLGTGLYAIYYSGSFPAYSLLVRHGSEQDFVPIYVGKAVPDGSRKGLASGTNSKKLYKRLQQHQKSIQAAENLDIADFSCRFLVVDPIWIPLGESLLISRYSPVWNSLLDGFGNHDPGKGRHRGIKPRWDVVHLGREWASRLQPRPETPAAICREVEEYLRQRLEP